MKTESGTGLIIKMELLQKPHGSGFLDFADLWYSLARG